MKARISRYPFFRVVIVLLALSAIPSQLPYAQNDTVATTPETQFQDDSAGVLSDSLVVPDTRSIPSPTLTVESPAADSEPQAAPSPEATSTDTSSIAHNDHDTTFSSATTPNDNVTVQPKYDQSTPAQPPPALSTLPDTVAGTPVDSVHPPATVVSAVAADTGATEPPSVQSDSAPETPTTEAVFRNISRRTKILIAAGASAAIIGTTVFILVKQFNESTASGDSGIPDPPDPPGYW